MAGIWPQMASLLWFLSNYEVYKTKANFIVRSYVKEKYKKSHNEVYSVQYVISGVTPCKVYIMTGIWMHITWIIAGNYHTFITVLMRHVLNEIIKNITLPFTDQHLFTNWVLRWRSQSFLDYKIDSPYLIFVLISPVIKRHSHKTIPTVTLCTSHRKVRNDTQLND